MQLMKYFIMCLSLIVLVAAQGFRDYSNEGLNGTKQADITFYSSEFGGERLLSIEDVEIRFTDGMPANLSDYIADYLLRSGSVWVEIEGDGIASPEGRYEFSGERAIRRESPGEDSEITEDMSIEMRIGNPGEDFMVESDRTGFGDPAPNERVTVAGAMSMQGLGSVPSGESGYGKVFVDNSNGHLMYVKEDGTVTDLTVDANAVQSVSSSANTTGRTEHMRFIPGEMTEITESATNDTIYIRYDLSMSTTGCSSAPAQPDPVDGITPICSGEPGTSYGVAPVPEATYYRWTVPTGATITDGFGTNIIHAILGDNDGNICVRAVNACGESPSRCFAVTINRPTSPGAITGATLVCEDTTGLPYEIDAVPGATNYIWTLPPGATIASGSGTPSIVVNFGTEDGEICVRTENSCGRSEPECIAITMTVTPDTPGIISGPTSICEGTTGSFSIATVAEATNYVWTVPAGASISSGAGTEAIDVLFGTTSGNVAVAAQSICGTSSTRSTFVTILQSPTITSNPSNQSVDAGETATFTVSATGAGTLTYQWQLSTDGGSSWSNVGSSASSYTTPSTTEGMSGYRYRCVVSGSCSPSATSAYATLTVVTSLYPFTSHTFSNCGRTGPNGPSLVQCRGFYSTTWDENPAYFNMSTNGIQEWTVPETGTYRITCAGAAGGRQTYGGTYATGGQGAIIRGDFSLTRGEKIYIICGQKGEDTRRSVDNAAPGGGGGSFVYRSATATYPLMAAGGGGCGARCASYAGYQDAEYGTSGNRSGSTTNGGSSGNGGTPNTGGSSYWAGGGCGWLTDGTGGNISSYYSYSSSYANGGRAPRNGAYGGTRYSDGTDEGGDGGFGGGGGGGSDNMGGGGGGGYSGGGGARYDSCGNEPGGGAGSYNGGSNQANVGMNSGHGYVTIQLL